MVDHYIFSGSLPENASTYVTRKADSDLYEGLKAGKFCYVLNSRQSGKSSLRVQTMRRLREEGVECAAIDLSAGGIQNVPPEQWYADLIDTLIESFGLDVNFTDWWSVNQLNSLVTRFRKFLEEILLAEVKEDIVIFIDEIDSVLSLKFPTDDFFAMIRACYNKRVDNPEYNRLTFCLLGVASPSNLIEDKQRTPFNIGKAISLTGFQLHEVEPLQKGLQGKFRDAQTIMKEILEWTGGQPFLTQKLCQFMVEESEKNNGHSVMQLVRSRIIENWESQDEPEHLRTIRNRILRDEQRAGYLLELYQQIRQMEDQSEITADETLEQSELQLSGLIVKQKNKLRVYNAIYKEVFDQNWIETQLKNLRPYSESFRFWVTSGGKDESRLLRGKALQDALDWALDKSLSYQDRQFLAASQAKEKEEKIAALEKEAALERERKDREAVEKRNQVLAEANRKAQQRISLGTVALLFTLAGAVISGILAAKQVTEAEKKQEEVRVAKQKITQFKKDIEDLQNKIDNFSSKFDKEKNDLGGTQKKLKVASIDYMRVKKELDERHKYLATIQELSTLTGELEHQGLNFEAKELFTKAAQSVNIKDYNLRLVLLYTGISYVYLYKIEDNIIRHETKKSQAEVEKYETEAEKAQAEAEKYLNNVKFNKEKSIEEWQIRILQLRSKAILLEIKQNINKSREIYLEAFTILNSGRNRLIFKKSKLKFLSFFNDVEALHLEVWQSTGDKNIEKKVKKSLKEYYYNELENLLANKRWEEAEEITSKLMTSLSKNLDFKPITNNSFCLDIRRIDDDWSKYSSGRFGFSVQKKIYFEVENTNIGKQGERYKRFAERMGWKKDEIDKEKQNQDIAKLPIGFRPLWIFEIYQPYHIYGHWLSLSSTGIGKKEDSVGVSDDNRSISLSYKVPEWSEWMFLLSRCGL